MTKKAGNDIWISKADAWFAQQGWSPFDFQQQTWEAFLEGKNGLLNAPTGSGKTFALWFPILLHYLKKQAGTRAESIRPA